jgi:hypothetical protein
LFKQLFAITTANPTQLITIPENALGTYALQNALAPDRAQNLFVAMLENADSRIFEDANNAPMIMCTKKLFDNYKNSIRNKPTDSAIQFLMGGFKMMMIDGYNIVHNPLWDRAINDFDNGTRKDLPNRAVLYQKQNLAVGVDSLSSLSEFAVGYDMRSDKSMVRGKYKADAKVLVDEFVMCAF